MAVEWILMLFAVAIPLTAAVIVFKGSANLTERHHAHHDTYIVPGTLSWGIVSSMLFMGALGVLVGWLCNLGAFTANSVVALSFFDGCLVTLFACLVVLRRYKVMTFDDHMSVTPFIGRTVTIPYATISNMEWSASALVSGSHNVIVHTEDRQKALLWAVLDLDQILIRIERYDVLENLRS